MLKFGSDLRYGIRSSNVWTPVDIPNNKRTKFLFQYEGDLSELEAQLASSKERVNKINQDMKPVEVIHFITRTCLCNKQIGFQL